MGKNWVALWYIVIYHVLLVFSLPAYLVIFGAPSIETIVSTFILTTCIGLSITMGYHRYFAHKTFKTNTIMKKILLFFGTLSAESSALRWAHDHRLHHKHVDTEQDPYSVTKGLFHAHIGWIFDQPKKIDLSIVPDLAKDKDVMHQHKHYPVLLLTYNIIAIGAIAFITKDIIGAFIFTFLVRTFLVHHSTWCINSLAHYWGERTYSKELSAVDNYIIALITWGEGYHNYHHACASDYRNGIRWYHFDPGKWLLWTLAKCGLVSNLHKIDTLQIKKKIILADKELLLKHVQTFTDSQNWQQKVQEVADSITTYIGSITSTRQEIINAKKQKAEKIMIHELKTNVYIYRKKLSLEWKKWELLVQQIVKTQPISVH